MNICMLVYHYYPVPAGGAEHQCRLQAQALTGLGHSCVVLTTRASFMHAAHERDGLVSVVRLNTLQGIISRWIDWKRRFIILQNNRPEKMSRVRAAGKASDAGGPLALCLKWVNLLLFMVGVYVYILRHRRSIDVMHTHVASWNAGFAAWMGSRFDIPAVCKASYLPAFHDYGRSVPFSRLWSRWRRRANFIALTEEMARDLAAEGVPAGQINIIPNGVSIPSVQSDVAHNKKVLYVGNLMQGSDHKGFDILLNAWSLVAKSAPHAKLMIAGGGDDTAWRRLANQLGCSDSVSFLGHVKDVKSLYLSACIFVLPSRGEGLSNALLEAQSYGIPAVVSDIPGNCEVVIHQKTGLVVPVGDAAQLAAEVVRLWVDDDLRERLGGQARRQAIDRFSMRDTANQLVELYSSLMHSQSGRERIVSC